MEGLLKKFGMICCLFAATFLMGYGVMIHTSDWEPIGRDPAAIRQVYDFSRLSGAELSQAMKKRLLSEQVSFAYKRVWALSLATLLYQKLQAKRHWLAKSLQE
jgi:hypothetical protein